MSSSSRSVPRAFPAGTSSDHLSILDTAIGPDGSFTAAGTEAGVLDNASARFKYSFTGYFGFR